MHTPQAGTESTGLAELWGDPRLPSLVLTLLQKPVRLCLGSQAYVIASGLRTTGEVWEGCPEWSLGKQQQQQHPGFILNLQPNTFERAPNSGAERAEWKQGGQVGAGSAGSFRNVSPPRQGRARHSPPCFTQEMSGTAVPLAVVPLRKNLNQVPSLGPVQIFEVKRRISQR